MSGHLPDDTWYRFSFEFSGTAAPNGAVTTIGGGSDTAQDPTVMAGALQTIWETTFLTAQVTTITLDQVVCRAGPDATGATGFAASGAAGTHIGSGASPNTSYLVRKTSASGGRRNRGRMYIPGVDEDKVDASGTITPAWVTTLQGVADDFVDACNLLGDNFKLVILHELVPGPTQPVPTLLTSLSVENLVATQRHRLRR